MPNKWSPEPWFERSDAPINLTAANYDRARECVNALAGVPDPAEHRAARVDLLDAAKVVIDPKANGGHVEFADAIKMLQAAIKRTEKK